jgi:hypothetical protein
MPRDARRFVQINDCALKGSIQETLKREAVKEPGAVHGIRVTAIQDAVID